MAIEALAEYPTDPHDQVTHLLDLHHPGLAPERRDTVHVCMKELRRQPFADQLLTKEPTLKSLIFCTVELVDDILSTTDFTLNEQRYVVLMASEIAKGLIIPAIEKESCEVIERRMVQGENPFMPKPISVPQAAFNHAPLFTLSGSTMSIN